MDYKNLIFTQEKGLAVITLNRPKAHNALCAELNDELEHVLSQLERDPEVKVVILTGGPKVFAAGADITEMANADPLKAYQISKQGHRVHDRLEELPYPTIAAINGLALGGGCELSLACDFRIAGENSMIGLPEISLGIFPGAGGTQRLAKLIGPSRAKEMVFLGGPIKGPKALELGMVNRIVPDDQVLEEAKKFAAKLMEKPRVALSQAKAAMSGIDLELYAGKQLEKAHFAMVCASDDHKEGMKAFIEKRPPVFTNK